MSCDFYMEQGFYKQRENIAKAIKQIQAGIKDFDSIVVTGISGMIFGPILVYEMNKHIVVVRQTFSEHSIYELLTNGSPNKYLFVDDLIASGKTARLIIKKMSQYYLKSSCVGAYLYSSMQVYSPEYVYSRL